MQEQNKDEEELQNIGTETKVERIKALNDPVLPSDGRVVPFFAEANTTQLTPQPDALPESEAKQKEAILLLPQEKGKQNKKHIVLDLDGTLVCDNTMSTTMAGVSRPYLKRFFAFLFNDPRIASVRIWTLASEERWEQVFRDVLKPRMPPEKMFAEVWTGGTSRRHKRHIRRHVIRMCHEFQVEVRLKPLRKYWKREKTNGMNRTNTIVIDNTSSTFLLNRGNAIWIPTYDRSMKSSDQQLLEMITFLDKYMLNAEDVRHNRTKWANH